MPHLIIDRPTGLTSHWAASTDRFAAEYGACIAAFAADEAAKGSLDCPTLERRERLTHRATDPPAPGGSGAPG